MSSSNKINTVWLRFPIALLGVMSTTLGILLASMFFETQPTGFQWATVFVWLGATLVGGPVLVVVAIFGRQSWVRIVFRKVFGDPHT